MRARSGHRRRAARRRCGATILRSRVSDDDARDPAATDVGHGDAGTRLDVDAGHPVAEAREHLDERGAGGSHAAGQAEAGGGGHLAERGRTVQERRAPHTDHRRQTREHGVDDHVTEHRDTSTQGSRLETGDDGTTRDEEGEHVEPETARRLGRVLLPALGRTDEALDDPEVLEAIG